MARMGGRYIQLYVDGGRLLVLAADAARAEELLERLERLGLRVERKPGYSLCG